VHPGHVTDLLAPSFPGALCREQWQLFDTAAGQPNRHDVAGAREQALALCASCPCLAQCRGWYGSLKPNQRPPGVIAGVLNTKRSAHTPW
jgi:hypothetical protein